MRRNCPVRLEPVNPRKRERHPAPDGTSNHAARDGFSRLSKPDPFYAGERQPLGGTDEYPPFRKDI